MSRLPSIPILCLSLTTAAVVAAVAAPRANAAPSYADRLAEVKKARAAGDAAMKTAPSGDKVYDTVRAILAVEENAFFFPDEDRAGWEKQRERYFATFASWPEKTRVNLAAAIMEYVFWNEYAPVLRAHFIASRDHAKIPEARWGQIDTLPLAFSSRVAEYCIRARWTDGMIPVQTGRQAIAREDQIKLNQAYRAYADQYPDAKNGLLMCQEAKTGPQMLEREAHHSERTLKEAREKLEQKDYWELARLIWELRSRASVLLQLDPTHEQAVAWLDEANRMSVRKEKEQDELAKTFKPSKPFAKHAKLGGAMKAALARHFQDRPDHWSHGAIKVFPTAEFTYHGLGNTTRRIGTWGYFKNPPKGNFYHNDRGYCLAVNMTFFQEREGGEKWSEITFQNSGRIVWVKCP